MRTEIKYENNNKFFMKKIEIKNYKNKMIDLYTSKNYLETMLN